MVAVTGTEDGNAAAVREIASIPEGLPLARLDTDAVTERLLLLPQIESVSVQRSWPSTVRIKVVERVPVALVDVDGVQWLIDRNAVLFAQVTEPPAGVPLLEVQNAASDDRATLAALEVIGALPADIRDRLARVSAETPDSVVLHLVGGRTVIWGSAEDSDRKALVLAGVFGQPGGTIDVSSPSAVVIR
ncbi:MAG: FtsQ-type POTRA domain-containing protein [Geodermatophilaceae bacterium]